MARWKNDEASIAKDRNANVHYVFCGCETEPKPSVSAGVKAPALTPTPPMSVTRFEHCVNCVITRLVTCSSELITFDVKRKYLTAEEQGSFIVTANVM